MMSNVTKKLMCFVLATTSLLSLCACGDREGERDVISDDPKTINVRINKAGHGTDYIYALKTKFEEIYREEGYKVNVLVPTNGFSHSSVNESIYNDDGLDMIFSGQEIELGVAGEYGTLYADITDIVYNQKPIRFDGTEEDTTVGEKIAGLQYDNSYGGKYYGLPYTFTVYGMGINTKAMAEFPGMEIPRTSNELFECIETIMSQATNTGIFPYTYSLQSNTYPMIMYLQWMAQYAGYDELKEFWSMQDSETGENLANPYEVYKSDAITESMKEFYRMMDYNTAAFGASTQDFKAAQNQWMNGDAVFYSVGSWVYNEEKIRNKNKIEDVILVRVPVISALGTKVFGAGTAYGYSAEKCEQILCAIIDGVDANKDAATITSEVNTALGVSLNEADVLEVCERVGYVTGNSDIENAIISVKSTKKDICALFFRMCASDDGASLIAHSTNTVNPFKLNALDDVNSNWHKGYTSLVHNRYMKQIPRMASGYRRQLGLTTLTPLTGDSLHTAILEDTVSIYNDYTYKKEKDYSVYYNKATELINDIYTNAKNQWESGLWN